MCQFRCVTELYKDNNINVKRNRKSLSNNISLSPLCICVRKYRVIVREFYKFENLFDKLKLPEIMKFLGQRTIWKFLLRLRGFKYMNCWSTSSLQSGNKSVYILFRIWMPSEHRVRVLRFWGIGGGGLPYTFLPTKLSSKDSSEEVGGHSTYPILPV